MDSTIRARFANGLLEPLEHLGVPEGDFSTAVSTILEKDISIPEVEG
jgi:hypothetical protein